jgi:hypothetical protein
MKRGKKWTRNDRTVRLLIRQKTFEGMEPLGVAVGTIRMFGHLVDKLQRRIHRLRVHSRKLRDTNKSLRQDNEVLLDNIRRAYDVLAQGQDVRESLGLLIGDLEVDFKERGKRRYGRAGWETE